VAPTNHVFKTFDKKFAEVAERCVVSRDEVEIHYFTNKYGLQIETLEQVTADPDTGFPTMDEVLKESNENPTAPDELPFKITWRKNPSRLSTKSKTTSWCWTNF
jgi:hypothetical protein